MPVRNKYLPRLGLFKHLNHMVSRLADVLVETVILKVEKGVVRRLKAEMLCGLECLLAPHLDQGWRIHEFCMRGASVSHDHNPHVCACHYL